MPFIPEELFASMIDLASKRGSKVFIGGIHQDLSSHDIKEYFSKFGAIEKCNLLPDRSTGRHRGFAFISYVDEIHADLACVNQFQMIKGKKVEVKKALGKNQLSTSASPSFNPTGAAGATIPNLPLFSVWPSLPLDLSTWNYQVRASLAT